MSLRDLFPERRLRCEADQKRKDDEIRAAARAERMAKLEARRAAVLADPTSPEAVQVKHAAEVRQRLAQDKRHKAMILARIQDDKLRRKEIQQRNRLNAAAVVHEQQAQDEEEEEEDTWEDCKQD